MGIRDNKSFFVLGMGRSGRSVAGLLETHGFDVVAYDDTPSVLAGVRMDREGSIRIADPDSAPGLLLQSDCLVVSPGVPLDHKYVTLAAGNGVTVTGEMEVAYAFCDSTIIGVTGTNGKSTVVKLVGSILAETDQEYAVAGNIGTPFSEVVETDEPLDTIVLEVSSFQLDTIDEFRADVAVLLNVTPDHLDRYDNSFEKYAKSKSRIINRADPITYLVYNAEDPVCVRIADGFVGKTIPFSSARVLDEGVYTDGNAIIKRWQGGIESIIPRRDFSPVGIHNLENAMAAVAAVAPFDITGDVIRRALTSYRPLPHRMELVRVVGGVAYINDSKATNIDATIKSVRSIENDLILILGGLDKAGDFGKLTDHLARTKKIILIGEARDKIRRALAGVSGLVDATTMEHAVRIAADSASPNNTVLLAPACASFDMFKSYEERGESFRAAVAAL